MSEYFVIALLAVFGVFMLLSYRFGYKSASHEAIVEKKLDFPVEEEPEIESEKLEFPQD